MRWARLTMRLCMFVAIVIAALLLGGATTTAHAYGPNALWQIAISGNCNNPTYCASLGGFWVWAEFDTGGQGDATVSDCSHLRSAHGSGLAGAQHVNIEITGWKIAPGSAGPATFFVTSEVDTITGQTGGPPVTVVIPSENFDTGVPAAPGHYSTSQVLGFSAPGVAFQIQVVAVPH